MALMWDLLQPLCLLKRITGHLKSRATLKFPISEVSLKEEEDEEEESKRILSVSGIVKQNILNGICTAVFKDENLSLQYAYKDEQLALTPRFSLPSNALSFAFKRRFGPADNLRSCEDMERISGTLKESFMGGG